MTDKDLILANLRVLKAYSDYHKLLINAEKMKKDAKRQWHEAWKARDIIAAEVNKTR